MMGPGTLYGSIGRMIETGFVRDSEQKIDPKMGNERRVYYEITDLGQQSLTTELERYRAVVALGRKKNLVRKHLSYDS